MAIFVLLACATTPFSAGGVGGGGGGERDLLLPEGLEEDDESVDAVGDRLTAFTLCSLVVSANTATSWGICLPCLPFNSSCVLTSNKEVAGWSAPVRVATGNNSNRSYEFIFREFKMLKGETVRNVVS